MAVTVGGTSITFNDATVQTTAATAPTTAQVLNATAGASAGSVGSYMWGYKASSGVVAFGGTTAGSTIIPGGGSTIPCVGALVFTGSGAAQAGTWRCMGYSSGEVNATGTIFLRIS